MVILSSILVSCYLLSSILLIVYGYNCYYLIYLFLKHKKRESSQHKQFIKTFYQQQSERPSQRSPHNYRFSTNALS